MFKIKEGKEGEDQAWEMPKSIKLFLFSNKM